MEYDNTNKGAFFKNDKKGNDKAPDYKGKLNVAGKEYKIAGWIRESKAGAKFMSLSVQEAGEWGAQKPAQEAKPAAAQVTGDEIPF